MYILATAVGYRFARSWKAVRTVHVKRIVFRYPFPIDERVLDEQARVIKLHISQQVSQESNSSVAG